MKKFFVRYLDDALIFLGLTLVVYATYLISYIAAIYAAGVCLLVLGVLIGIGQKGVKK